MLSHDSVYINTPEDILGMRRAGKLAAAVLEFIAPHVCAGVSTAALDRLCHEYILAADAIPAPLNYRGFPKSICTSINHVVCHGIPSETKLLKAGDIINIDITVIKDGYHGDTSKMFLVGKPSIQAARLVQITQECLYLAMKLVRPGTLLSAIGRVIQEHAEAAGYSVVRDYCGHGIGKTFHAAPQVLHYYQHWNRHKKRYELAYSAETDLALLEGMTFTIEPMINLGSWETRLEADQWTVVTRDRSLSAQFEHTLLVTKDGVEILTLREEESILAC
jgi:methionyl aminopeptidase